MSEESAMIAGAVISALSALGGAGLNWLLTNVTATEAARRAERSAIRESLEKSYLSVQTSLELFIRSPTRGAEIDKELASLNAVVTLFGNDEVRLRFKKFSEEFHIYEKAYEASEKKYASIADASDDFPAEWNRAMSSMYKVSKAMRTHIEELRAFKT